MTYTLYWEKIASGIVAGCIGVLTKNLAPLLAAVVIFELVDFITGCWKSSVESKRHGEHFAFESIKAWRTIYKIVFIMIGIVLSEMLDMMISDQRLRLANFFTAFACGVEFWSFLENAAVISNHPIFRWLRKFMKAKIEDNLDTKFEDGND